VILAGWVAYHQLAHRSGARAVAWHDLTASLERFESPRPGSHAFRTKAELTDYLSALMPGRRVALPRIDFAADEAFLVTVGPRSSTGYKLRIVRVTARPGNVTVLLRELTPALATQVLPRITYPFRLITIPRTSKPVYAKFLGRP
jgi:hypothetical protein